MLKKFSKYKLAVTIIVLCFSLKCNANNGFLAEKIEKTSVSLITCDPGDEIYSLFGHSAIRIKNPESKIDLVVNWGIFSFSGGEFQFGYDFAKGRLKYRMGFQKMEYFIKEYQVSNRPVREQILNLSNNEKKKLLNLVEENYLPKNREYKYEFFYDNCSSRIRDLLSKTFGQNISWGESEDAGLYSFRNIIHNYLKYDPWLELGIDLVLGKRIDVLVNNKNLMFLPTYLETILDTSFYKNGSKNKIVSKKINIVKSKQNKRVVSNINIYSWLTLIVTLLLLVLKKEKLFNIWSNINLSVVGVLGLLLIFMWWGTDHQATKYNLNLLWASPFHFLLVYFIVFKKWNKFIYWYILISLVLLFITVLFWFTMTQELNSFVKPIILQLGLIYFYYMKKNKNLINLDSTRE